MPQQVLFLSSFPESYIFLFCHYQNLADFMFKLIREFIVVIDCFLFIEKTVLFIKSNGNSIQKNIIKRFIYRRMLVKVFIDKIYLYDDKYRILFKYSGKRTKEKTALEIERHFNEGCSSTSLCSPP